jgi:hypothetical protein
MGKWKGVRLKVAKNPNGPIELYNLDKDIAEKNNIAEKHPKIVAKMASTMKSARVHDDEWPFGRRKKR